VDTVQCILCQAACTARSAAHSAHCCGQLQDANVSFLCAPFLTADRIGAHSVPVAPDHSNSVTSYRCAHGLSSDRPAVHSRGCRCALCQQCRQSERAAVPTAAVPTRLLCLSRCRRFFLHFLRCCRWARCRKCTTARCSNVLPDSMRRKRAVLCACESWVVARKGTLRHRVTPCMVAARTLVECRQCATFIVQLLWETCALT
jgi:hypothetical protein